MAKIIYVGIGGFIGAALRYLISSNSSKWFGSQLPYGTLIVNVIGGLLIGFIMQLSVQTSYISADLKLFLTTGIIGGLTTFSTFSYETIQFFGDGQYFYGIINTCLNLFLSFGGVALGKFLGSKLI
mgnify:CR=1 FL=1